MILNEDDCQQGVYCKYKQHKEFIVMCISKHIVCVEKVQIVNFF